jgi:hypothetical protein
MTQNEVEEIMTQAVKRPWAKARPIIEAAGLTLISLEVLEDDRDQWLVTGPDGRQWSVIIANHAAQEIDAPL